MALTHPQFVNGDLAPAGDALGLDAALAPDWREYFLALLQDQPRFVARRRYLRTDIAGVMRRLIPEDTRVLEVGVGGGHVLAALPNEVRDGIDVLPEAIDAAQKLDPTMHVELGDVRSFKTKTRYGAIVC